MHSLCLSLCVCFSLSHCHVRTQQEDTIYDPGMELSPESNHAAILIWTASLQNSDK